MSAARLSLLAVDLCIGEVVDVGMIENGGGQPRRTICGATHEEPTFRSVLSMSAAL